MRFRFAYLVLAFALLHCANSTIVASKGSSGAGAAGAGGAPPQTTTGAAGASPQTTTGAAGAGGASILPDGGDGGSSTLPDASPDGPPACGVRTGMRGLTNRSLMVAGLMRTYLIYLPASADPTAPLPFVYVFHGYTMSGQDMYDITQYTALADSEGIGLAFPDGEGGPNSLAFPWNVENSGQTVCGSGQFASAAGDDFAFMDAMKADVSQDQCLDTAHIFSTGFSMGSYFTEHVGCYRSDIRAVSPHSGGTLADLSVCTTGHVPVILFHGTSDPVIADTCDDPTMTPLAGFPASATLWAQKNGCQKTYSTVPNQGAQGGGTGQCYLYDGCPADGQVELCTFNGMGHCWAGGASGSIYACSTYASATQLEWSFFKQYAW